MADRLIRPGAVADRATALPTWKKEPMTGPEHYRKAEELLSLAADYDKDRADVSAARCRAEAQVHATLAAAAVTALVAGAGMSSTSARVAMRSRPLVHDWIETVGSPSPTNNE